MKKHFWTTWLLNLALSSQLGLAADSTEQLTLEQAVSEGMGLSPTLQKYQSAKDQANWDTHLGLSGLLPKIDLKAKYNFSTQYETVPVSLNSLIISVPVVFPQTSFGVEAQWTLFDGLANVRNYQASLSRLEAAKQDLSRKDFETKKRIELAFFSALAAKRFEEVAQENVKTLEENLRQVRYRAQNGVSTQYDVLRVEVQFSDASTELERTRDSVIIQRRLLAQAMGKDDDLRPVDGELPTPTLVQVIQNLSAPDLHDRQDFQAEELRSQAADQQAKAAAGALFPAIGLAAQYEKYQNTGYPGDPGSANDGFRDAWNVGVFLKWSILDGGATIARSGAARANAERAEHEYQEAVLTLPADYELWKRRYVYSSHRYDAKAADLKRSQESLRIAEVSFQQGRKTITEVLEAETDLFRARAGVVQSQLDAEESLVKLELTLGKEVKL